MGNVDHREVDRRTIAETLKAEYIDEYADMDNDELVEQAQYYQEVHEHDTSIAMILDFYSMTANSLRDEHRTKLVLHCAECKLAEEY